MKILCVSDYVDPLVYNQNVKEVFADVDLILCAGDLPMDYIDFIVTVFNKPTYFIFGNHNLKEFHFYHKDGRDGGKMMHSYSAHENDHGETHLGFKIINDNRFIIEDPASGKKSPLLIAGCSGSKKYNNGLCQYSEFQMKMKLLKMVPKLIYNKVRYGRYLDILMTHASPRHIHDHEDPCHVGFECYNWFLKKYQPSYMIHGHIHLYDMREERTGKYFNTIVTNAYAHTVIELPLPQTNQE